MHGVMQPYWMSLNLSLLEKIGGLIPSHLLFERRQLTPRPLR